MVNSTAVPPFPTPTPTLPSFDSNHGHPSYGAAHGVPPASAPPVAPNPFSAPNALDFPTPHPPFTSISPHTARSQNLLPPGLSSSLTPLPPLIPLSPPPASSPASFASSTLSHSMLAPTGVAQLSQTSPMTPYRSFVDEQNRQSQFTSNDRRNESMERTRNGRNNRAGRTSRGASMSSSRRPGPAHSFPLTPPQPQVGSSSLGVHRVPSPYRPPTHKSVKLAIFPYTLVSILPTSYYLSVDLRCSRLTLIPLRRISGHLFNGISLAWVL